MNFYKKYCPNVFVAACKQKYEKGDLIVVTTKRGKENESIVHNFVGYAGTRENPLFCYSVTRADGFNMQERARRKAERFEHWAESAEKRGEQWRKASEEGKDFLSLGEPIKVGHHSERRHRALIARNWNRFGKYVKEGHKAQAHRDRAAYWASREEDINLSMPESIEYFQFELEKAQARHKGLKDGTIPRSHSYSLTYAKKKVNDLQKKYKTAVKLWG